MLRQLTQGMKRYGNLSTKINLLMRKGSLTVNFMMTSSNGHFLALLAICAGNSPVPGEFPVQRPVTRRFDVFDLRLNKRLSKQSCGWWFETLPCPSWRHFNVSTTSRHSYLYSDNPITGKTTFIVKLGPLWIPLPRSPCLFFFEMQIYFSKGWMVPLLRYLANYWMTLLRTLLMVFRLNRQHQGLIDNYYKITQSWVCLLVIPIYHSI